MSRPPSSSWATSSEIFETTVKRVAVRGDHWTVSYSKHRRSWVAEPTLIAVWAMKTAKQAFFPTWAEAFAYAQKRTTQR